ncbi:hypothetical protein TrVE_jg316 [Triparma verrucosa]|uniref:Peroxisomal membrane protein 4 n=2 Tax=Triparma TaxID=722752 RepID=A0A9W6ZQF6_9STRA|nr:hypothetical protein TrST_g5684 [Triparma strigata]GMH85391.1 hypothetical protein TrVE_jg316 [Triparma verrucosa]
MPIPSSNLLHHLPPTLLSPLLSSFSGIKYALKLRLPHALLMTYLFTPSLPPSQKLSRIKSVLLSHATSLGLHALIYKLTLLLLNKLTKKSGHTLQKIGRPLRPYHSFLAGAVGGYVVWGDFTSVNYQVNLYLLGRVLAGIVNARDGKGGNVEPKGYRFMSVVVWGAVMYLFEKEPESLQYGLRSSMEEVYRLDERVEAGMSIMSTRRDQER